MRLRPLFAQPWLVVVGLLAASGPAVAQDVRAETFLFPQPQDTTFGNARFLGDFNWFAEGHGVHGRRISTKDITSLQAFGFKVFLDSSCIDNVQPVYLDVCVNDRLVASAKMPGHILCNTPLDDPVQAHVTINPPIAGLGSGNEYEVRFQLRGNASAVQDLFAFYSIDPSTSTIAIAGSATPVGAAAPSNATNQLQQSNAAVAAVKSALGIVDSPVTPASLAPCSK